MRGERTRRSRAPTRCRVKRERNGGPGAVEGAKVQVGAELLCKGAKVR